MASFSLLRSVSYRQNYNILIHGSALAITYDDVFLL